MNIEQVATVAATVATLIAANHPFRSWVLTPPLADSGPYFEVSGSAADFPRPELVDMLAEVLADVDPTLRNSWVLSVTRGQSPRLAFTSTQIDTVHDAWAVALVRVGAVSTPTMPGVSRWSITVAGVLLTFTSMRMAKEAAS